MSSIAAVVLSSYPEIVVCYKCKKSEEVDKFSRCARCHIAKYCGRECQTADWPAHRKVCVLTAKCSDIEAVWASITVHPASSKKSVVVHEKSYASAAAWWAEQTKTTSSYWDVLAENLGSRITGTNALDLGCGAGHNSLLLINMGWNVTAIDSSEGVVAKFKGDLTSISKIKGAKEVVDRIDLKFMDAHEFSFSEKYDLILAKSVFPYLDPTKIRELLQNAYNSLNANGCLLGTFFIEPDEKVSAKHCPVLIWTVKGDKEARAMLESLGKDTKIEFCYAKEEVSQVVFMLRKV